MLLLTEKPATCALLVAWLCLAVSAVGHAEEQSAEATSPFRVTSEIPPGFERFHEPQLTAVDLYYGGRPLMTTLAEYSPGFVQLREPEAVADSIPDLINREALLDIISKKMESNADRVCQQAGQSLCGRLDPAVAAVIFDENSFRLTLFIHQSLLAEAEPEDARYLPPPDRDSVTLVQNLSAVASGNDSGDNQYSLYGSTRAGYNGHYGFSDWFSTDTNSFSADSLGYTHLLRDHEITTGLFDPDPTAFRSIRRDILAGISVSTSTKRRQDLDSIIASPIELFLPIRGRVDIFRDGRLISSGFYEAGNQLIDSTSLPGGIYQIEIVVTDDSGNSVTEQQLFVKSSLLPPPGQPRWFAEAGAVRIRNAETTLPESAQANMLRAAYQWRHNRFLSWGLGSIITDEQMVAELSSNLFSEWIEVGGEIYTSSEGGAGWGLRGTSRFWEATMTVTSQQNRADDADYIFEANYPLLQRDRWLHSIQASRNVSDNGRASISHSYSGSDPGDSIHRSTLGYTHKFNLEGGNTINFGAELSRTSSDNRIQLYVDWRANRGHWNNSARADWTQSDLADSDGLAVSASTRWHDRELYADDIQVGASARHSNNSDSLKIDGEHLSHLGRGRAAVTASSFNGIDTQQYSLAYNTGLVMNEEKKFALGGPLPGESAVILDLSGADDVDFNLYTNGQRQFSATGGGRTPLLLPAYRQYQVSITDRGATMASFDEGSKEAVLYVGDVDTLDYRVERINILVSRLFAVNRVCSEVTDECYAIPLPMADTRVEGVKGLAFTDSRGYFQADVPSTAKQLTAVFNGHACVIDITELEPQNGVLRASRLYCESGDEPRSQSGDESTSEANASDKNGPDASAPQRESGAGTGDGAQSSQPAGEGISQ